MLQCGRFNSAFPSRAAASLCYSVKDCLSLGDGLGLITNVVAEVDRWGAEPDAEKINHSQLNCKLENKRNAKTVVKVCQRITGSQKRRSERI